MTQKKRPLLLRLLGMIFGLAAGVALAVVFYLSVVLGQPQASEMEAVELHQPLTSAAPTQQIQSAAQLNSLLADFPVPVMCAPASSGYVLESGSAYDVEFEGGVARVVRLQYATPDGYVLAVDSIYPARALSILKYGDYHLTAEEGCALAGMRSVCMENGETMRLHAQSATGLYAVTVPMSAARQAALVVQPLHLMSAE